MSGYQFTDITHPCANGKTPGEDDEIFDIYVPLEYGETLTLHLGAGGVVVLAAALEAMTRDRPAMREAIRATVVEIVGEET